MGDNQCCGSPPASIHSQSAVPVITSGNKITVNVPSTTQQK